MTFPDCAGHPCKCDRFFSGGKVFHGLVKPKAKGLVKLTFSQY